MTLILAPAEISEWQAYAYIESKGPGAYPPETVALIVSAYWQIGYEEKVRPEVALAQSLKETGYFRFGGAVRPGQNNFAGIGATGGGEPGKSWPSIIDGVRGHLRRLRLYATPALIVTQVGLHDLTIILRPLPERYWGSAPTVEKLSGKWAPSLTYGDSIVESYLNPMLGWPDPSRPLEPGELVSLRRLLNPVPPI